MVRRIDANRDKKQVEAWIINMNELHSKKGVNNVKYKGRMPEIESLMQVWPSEVEEALVTQVRL